VYHEAARHTYIDDLDRATLCEMPYISAIMVGSPAEVAQLGSGMYILNMGQESSDYEVQALNNIKKIENQAGNFLPAFVKRFIAGLTYWKYSQRETDGDNFVRLQLISRKGTRKVVSMKLNEDDCPTWMLVPGMGCSDKVIRITI
jgi:hypothetical protein